MDVAKQEHERWSSYHAALMAQEQRQELASAEKAAPRKKSGLEALIAMEKGENEEDKVEEKKLKKPHKNMLLQGRTPDAHVLRVLRAVRSGELEEALMLMPFSYMAQMIGFLLSFLNQGCEVELSTRCATFLLSLHHNQIVSNQVMVTALNALRRVGKRRLREMKDRVGFNLAGLRFVDKAITTKRSAYYFGERNDEDKFTSRKREIKKQRTA
jgi:U3 small nucleolar RNA-associated protein 12